MKQDETDQLLKMPQSIKMLKDAQRWNEKPATDQQTGQRINGSKSLIKIANRQNGNVKKSSCLEDALKCPAEYE